MNTCLALSIASALVACVSSAAIGCSSGTDETTAAGGSSTTSVTTSTSSSVGGGGSGGATTTTTGAAGGSGGSGGETMPTHLPTATGACPDMKNLSAGQATFAGQPATVWSGDATGGGPLLIYYYATGSNAMEPFGTIGAQQIATIKSMGGAVVAQNATTAKGGTTGNNVWYKGDAEIADEIVACAIQNQKIDPRRIHVAGYSAGAIQTTFMWWARSGYVASVLTYSGGNDGLNKAPPQSPAHPPAALVTHGAKGKDTYGGVIDFADASAAWVADIKAANGFAIDCDDGGTHTDFITRTKIAPQALQFFLDHPYGVTPEPYTMLPSGWPAYCVIQ